MRRALSFSPLPRSAGRRKQTILRITSRCHDVPEPDPQSPSPWRCSHPVKECGVL